ncbi:MAG TPA: sulfide/dihydroorotate dehydrogenase-like FAD/NAD-binding protein [Planctomycetota bacterium]|nr:sulfide/dihydroorotate dehydrogenase-like FAD/NAD-binding protein [Planctomycetota bacterium]
MAKVVARREIAPQTVLLELEAPKIAAKRRPGQFVILKKDEAGERIPLTIAMADHARGTITVIFQMVGAGTRGLGAVPVGGEVMDVVGPLGKPTDIHKVGTVVSVGGGIGTAVAYPIAEAMKAMGNRVIGIIGARNKDLLILEDEFRKVADELLVTTDDGSYVRKGFVTDVLKEVIARGAPIAEVLAIGPVPMMKAVCKVTKEAGIKTVVSLNPIMIDGTGMCGGCRVDIGGQTKFACVDGPEFDGHLVNWDVLGTRLSAYKAHEQEACRLHGAEKR